MTDKITILKRLDQTDHDISQNVQQSSLNFFYVTKIKDGIYRAITQPIKCRDILTGIFVHSKLQIPIKQMYGYKTEEVLSVPYGILGGILKSYDLEMLRTQLRILWEFEDSIGFRRTELLVSDNSFLNKSKLVKIVFDFDEKWMYNSVTFSLYSFILRLCTLKLDYCITLEQAIGYIHEYMSSHIGDDYSYCSYYAKSNAPSLRIMMQNYIDIFSSDPFTGIYDKGTLKLLNYMMESTDGNTTYCDYLLQDNDEVSDEIRKYDNQILSVSLSVIRTSGIMSIYHSYMNHTQNLPNRYKEHRPYIGCVWAYNLAKISNKERGNG